MSKVYLWFIGLSRGKRALLTVGFSLFVIAVLAVSLYLVFVPRKVLVRYGTIVRDPIDGRVWSDNTKTAYVHPKDAPNYKIEYVDKYSPEHEKQLAEERARKEAEEKQKEEETGFEGIAVITGAELSAEMESVRENIESAGSSVVTGMQVASEISATKSSLIKTRNEIAAIPVPPQLQGVKNEVISCFDMYIRACDLYLEGIAEADLSKIAEAERLTKEATAKLQETLGAVQSVP